MDGGLDAHLRGHAVELGRVVGGRDDHYEGFMDGGHNTRLRGAPSTMIALTESR